MNVQKNPFPHLIIDDFLSDEDFSHVCSLLEEVETHRIESDLFSFEQSDDLTANTDYFFFKQKLLDLLPQISHHFAIFPQVVDLMAAFYYDGDHLLPHDDRLDNRKIAYTFYLTPSQEGGELALRVNKKPYAIKENISVVSNRLILFLVSQDSLHEVLEVKGELPRISVSGWFS